MATLKGFQLLWFLPEFLSSVQLIQMQLLIKGMKQRVDVIELSLEQDSRRRTQHLVH